MEPVHFLERFPDGARILCCEPTEHVSVSYSIVNANVTCTLCRNLLGEKPAAPDAPRHCDLPIGDGKCVRPEKHDGRCVAKYLEWGYAGGEKDCRHGYGEGVPCPRCDWGGRTEKPAAPEGWICVGDNGCHCPRHRKPAAPDALGEAIEQADGMVRHHEAGGNSDALNWRTMRSLLHQARAAHAEEIAAARAEVEGLKEKAEALHAKHLATIGKGEREVKLEQERDALRVAVQALNDKLDAACPVRCPKCGNTAPVLAGEACAECWRASLAAAQEREGKMREGRGAHHQCAICGSLATLVGRGVSGNDVYLCAAHENHDSKGRPVRLYPILGLPAVAHRRNPVTHDDLRAELSVQIERLRNLAVSGGATPNDLRGEADRLAFVAEWFARPFAALSQPAPAVPEAAPRLGESRHPAIAKIEALFFGDPELFDIFAHEVIGRMGPEQRKRLRAALSAPAKEGK